MPAPQIRPSFCTPYFDWRRFAELLCDGKDVPVQHEASLDQNVRALELTRAAYTDLLMAVRRGNKYTKKEIEDLIVDYTLEEEGAQLGQQVISLVADLLWIRAITRKRYVKDNPQGADPAIERTDDLMDKLRRGERIFVLEGVHITDDNYQPQSPAVYYGAEIPNAGYATGGDPVNEVGDGPTSLWGCSRRTPGRYQDEYY